MFGDQSRPTERNENIPEVTMNKVWKRVKCTVFGHAWRVAAGESVGDVAVDHHCSKCGSCRLGVRWNRAELGSCSAADSTYVRAPEYDGEHEGFDGWIQMPANILHLARKGVDPNAESGVSPKAPIPGTPATPQQLGVDVARALGLPLDNLTSFTLSCCNSKATIEATFMAPTDGQLEEVLKSYMVVERG